MPNIPKYAPPTVTANITSSGLIFNEFPTIFGFIMFASICCNIITIIPIQIAWPIPPVNIVIIIDIPTPTIAPKYGIRFDIPIKNPSNTAYFTPKIPIAIEANIPTIIASNI